MTLPNDRPRCPWPGNDPLYCHYHDTEWGVPVYDDNLMFSHLLLETFQAGLSWITILRKRENFARAFANFDAHDIARFDESHIEALMQNAGIIRNHKKIEAAINNARAFLDIQEKTGSFSDALWQFVGGSPCHNTWEDISEVPAITPVSQEISTYLKQNGFVFVGPTTCYAHMQATGMVNDHLVDCFRHEQIRAQNDKQ